MHASPHELRESASRLSADIDQTFLFGDVSPEQGETLYAASLKAAQLLHTLDRLVRVAPKSAAPGPTPETPSRVSSIGTFFSDGKTPTVSTFARAEAAKSAAPEWARKFFAEYAASPPEAKPGYLEFTILVRKIEDLARRTAALESRFAGPVKV